MTDNLNNASKRILEKTGWLLAVFILLNIIFKTIFISQESIYGDEAYSIYNAQKSLADLREIFQHDQNPPGHLLLLHFWMKVAGISDVSAKLLSVLFSVMAAAILFLFAKKFLSKQTAIIVSTLFLLSNAQLFYSQEIRPYALIQFLCISSFYFYFNLWKETKQKDVIFLAIVNLFLLFSHYLSVFIFIVQFICSFLFLKENKKGFLYYFISQTITAFLFIPWVKVMIDNIPKGGGFWNVAPNYNDFKYHVFIITGGEVLYYVFNVIVLCSILMLLLNKRFKFYEEAFKTRYYILFLSLYILPIALDFYVAQYTPVFLSRYILYSTFGLFLLVAYVMSSLNARQVIKTVLFLPLLLLLLFSFKFKQEKEDDWKTIIPVIKRAQTKNSVILISASYKFRDFSFYYDINAFKDYNKTIERLAKEGVYCSPTDEWFGWNKLNYNNIDKIIYVQSHSQFEDPEGKIKEFILEHHYKVCDHYERINIAYTIYIRDSMDCYTLKILDTKPRQNCEAYQETAAVIEGTDEPVSIYKTDMEPLNNCPVTTNEEKANSGKYSCKINEQNQYSICFSKLLSELNGMKKVAVSAVVNYMAGSKGRLVVSVEKNNETLFRSETAIVENINTPDSWKKIASTCIIPNDAPGDAELKIYFWNPAVNNVYVDDMEIILSR